MPNDTKQSLQQWQIVDDFADLTDSETLPPACQKQKHLPIDPLLATANARLLHLIKNNLETVIA